MLSKKNFLRFLKSGRVGHMVDYPNCTPSGDASSCSWGGVPKALCGDLLVKPGEPFKGSFKRELGLLSVGGPIT